MISFPTYSFTLIFIYKIFFDVILIFETEEVNPVPDSVSVLQLTNSPQSTFVTSNVNNVSTDLGTLESGPAGLRREIFKFVQMMSW